MKLFNTQSPPGDIRQGPQFLEDLATAYWLSEALFAGVETQIFTLLDSGGKTAGDVAQKLGFEPGACGRFLEALTSLGLTHCNAGVYYNTPLSSRYLIKGRQNYQGDSILWRKKLTSGWQELTQCLGAGGRTKYPPEDEHEEQRAARYLGYSRAMDNIARVKAREVVKLCLNLKAGQSFSAVNTRGRLLDLGCGSGAMAAAFLETFPALTATLVDLPEMLDLARQSMRKKDLENRVDYHPFNILEPWCLEAAGYSLVVLSNILHVYGETDVCRILNSACQCLAEGGLLLVHDFFFEHYPPKGALFDLNMLINTYSGQVHRADRLRQILSDLGLCPGDLLPLESDTAVILARKERAFR